MRVDREPAEGALLGRLASLAAVRRATKRLGRGINAAQAVPQHAHGETASDGDFPQRSTLAPHFLRKSMARRDAAPLGLPAAHSGAALRKDLESLK